MLLGGLVGGDGELTEGREKGWKVDEDWGGDGQRKRQKIRPRKKVER